MNVKRLSELSGFSPATVSNALNGKRGVSAATREKIVQLARESGYLKEEEETAGREGLIRVVTYRDSGKVFSDSPFFSSLLEGIENECHALRLETAVVNLYRHEPDYEARLAELLSDEETGILLIGTELRPEDARPFAEAAAPLVLLDCWLPGVPLQSVLMENEFSVHRVVDHLVREGHRRIGYLRSSVRIENFVQRERGLLEGLRAHGLTLDEHDIIEVPPSIVGACDAMRKALDSGHAMPTAFFADNDMIALGAMQTMQASGWRIPQDISIIGFDDITFSAAFTPGLTTVHVPKKELGRVAVRRLVDIMQHPATATARLVMDSNLVVRGSVAAPRSSQP